MKLGTVRITVNDDNTCQICCEAMANDGRYGDGKEIKYSADSLEDVVEKILEAKKEIEGMKDKTKKDARSLKAFIDE